MPVDVIAPRTHKAGPSTAVLSAPLGPPEAPRSVGPVCVVARAVVPPLAPGELPPDADVRPHPHIGLVAMTYLLEGHVTHRDSLGNRHEVGAGDVSWMRSGRGAVHSERFERLRLLGGGLDLAQILFALPDGEEDSPPTFRCVAAEEVPQTIDGGCTVRRVAGLGTQLTIGVSMFVHDVALDAGAAYTPPPEVERAAFVLAGSVTIEGTPVGLQATAVLPPHPLTIPATEGPARLLVFGGAPVGPRYLWWNYLHSSLERIEAARAEWRAGRTPLPAGDTESFTPAPPDDGRPLQRLNGT